MGLGNEYKIENNLIKCLNNCMDMVSCGLAGHRCCIVSNGSNSFHLCVESIDFFI